LKKITITPAAHGHIFDALYSTLMIRISPKSLTIPFLAHGRLFT
jgi:hypothetical protein